MGFERKGKFMSKPSLGVIFHPKFPPETLSDFDRRAESAGCNELWLWDDCFLPSAFTSAAIAKSVTMERDLQYQRLSEHLRSDLFPANDK